MFFFGSTSKARLLECDPRLQTILNAVIKHMDFTVLCATRSRADQEEAVRKGLSRAQYGESPHNFSPALAVDIAPYPVDWRDFERFSFLGGLMKGVASAEGIALTWGYDWNNNGTLGKDDPAESLIDAPHFELSNWKELT